MPKTRSVAEMFNDIGLEKSRDQKKIKAQIGEYLDRTYGGREQAGSLKQKGLNNLMDRFLGTGEGRYHFPRHRDSGEWMHYCSRDEVMETLATMCIKWAPGWKNRAVKSTGKATPVSKKHIASSKISHQVRRNKMTEIEADQASAGGVETMEEFCDLSEIFTGPPTSASRDTHTGTVPPITITIDEDPEGTLTQLIELSATPGLSASLPKVSKTAARERATARGSRLLRGPSTLANTKAVHAFNTLYPDMGYELIPTDGTGLHCAFNAAIETLSWMASQGFNVPVPTLSGLLEVFTNVEVQDLMAEFGLTNSNHWTVDQAGAIINFWSETYHDAPLRMGYIIDGRPPMLAVALENPAVPAIIFFVHNDNVSANDPAAINHFSGLRKPTLQANVGTVEHEPDASSPSTATATVKLTPSGSKRTYQETLTNQQDEDETEDETEDEDADQTIESTNTANKRPRLERSLTITMQPIDLEGTPPQSPSLAAPDPAAAADQPSITTYHINVPTDLFTRAVSQSGASFWPGLIAEMIDDRQQAAQKRSTADGTELLEEDGRVINTVSRVLQDLHEDFKVIRMVIEGRRGDYEDRIRREA